MATVSKYLSPDRHPDGPGSLGLRRQRNVRLVGGVAFRCRDEDGVEPPDRPRARLGMRN